MKDLTSREASLQDPSRARFAEPAKLLPVVFVISLIGGLWFIYVWWHCIPLLQEARTFYLGWTQLSIFNFMVLLLVINYARCIFEHPGTIPDQVLSGDNPWEVTSRDEKTTSRLNDQGQAVLQERKKSGETRVCKWCSKYKPDRAHHCRVCRTCVLKMDHHCPWIYNCVGFRNYKYFYLLIMYSVLCLQVMIWTMWSTLTNAVANEATPFITLFFLLFGESLAMMLSLVLMLFFSFHTYLMCKAMTTIEYCEKSKNLSWNVNRFCRGPIGNLKSVLGENVVLWFFPCSPPVGDGLSFITEDTPLIMNMDTEKGHAEKGHEKRRLAHQR